MEDYSKIGFKCGIECHQQIESHKLFCNCPSLVNDPSAPDIIFERKLRASAGETGKVDLAAQHEMSKGKKFIYEACSTSSCLVEADEQPPKKVNQYALETALQVALLLDAKVLDEIQFMRKTVIDGSNVSGFQRTALVAVNGMIETSKGIVKIPTICLEEESAKKIEDGKDFVKYRLDRLGIPLVEVSTDASIKDPEHAKEVASLIGMILRSTNRVKRGLGTIRQDVNVSIQGKNRVELKGFQDLRSIPKVIEKEVTRRLAMKGDHPAEVRKVEPDFTSTFLRPMPGAARMYPETDVPVIKIDSNELRKIKLPELISERALKIEKEFNLPASLARELIENEKFMDYVLAYKNLKPAEIARILVEVPKEIKTRFDLDIENISEDSFELVLGALNSRKIPPSAVIEILSKAAEGKKISIEDYRSMSDSDLEKAIKEIVSSNKGMTIGALMGIVMSKFKGKVDGKKASELIKKYM